MNTQPDGAAAERAAVPTLRAAPRLIFEVRTTTAAFYEDGGRGGSETLSIEFQPAALAVRAEMGEANWAVLTYLIQIAHLDGGRLVTPPCSAKSIGEFMGKGRAAIEPCLKSLTERGFLESEVLRGPGPTGRSVVKGSRYWLSPDLHARPKHLRAVVDEPTQPQTAPRPTTDQPPRSAVTPRSATPVMSFAGTLDETGLSRIGASVLTPGDPRSLKSFDDCERVAREWGFQKFQTAVAGLDLSAVVDAIQQAAAPQVTNRGAYLRRMLNSARENAALAATAPVRPSPAPRGRTPSQVSASDDPERRLTGEQMEAILRELDEATRVRLDAAARDAVYDLGKDPTTSRGRGMYLNTLADLLRAEGLDHLAG